MYGMDGSASSAVGGFQQMTQDALTVLNSVPFSIPPYFALIARAVVTLEGIALQGNPDYGLIMEAYPFVARKLLRHALPPPIHPSSRPSTFALCTISLSFSLAAHPCLATHTPPHPSSFAAPPPAAAHYVLVVSLFLCAV